MVSTLISREKTVTVRRANLYCQYHQHNRAGVVRLDEEDTHASEVHASALSDKGATVAGGGGNVLIKSIVVGDMLARGEVIMGDVVVATRGDDEALREHLVVVIVGYATAVGDKNARADVVVGKCPLSSELLCVVSQ